jgi:hypothetical protein
MAKISREMLVEKLHAMGVIRQDRYIAFQEQYGGLSFKFGVMTLTWGLIHTNSFDMAPDELESIDHDYAKDPLLRCLDSDPQDTAYIDEEGALYDCCGDRAFDSFEMLFAQRAFLFRDHRRDTRGGLGIDLLADGERIDEFSDTTTQVYRWHDKLIEVRDQVIIATYSRK